MVPFDPDDQGPTGPTLGHLRCPPAHEEGKVCWAKVSAHPELTHLLLDQPLTLATPFIRGPEPYLPDQYVSFHCCKSHRVLNSHPIVITSHSAGAGRVSAAVTPQVSPAVQLVAARAVVPWVLLPCVCGLWLSAEVSAGAASQNICTMASPGPLFPHHGRIMLRARVPRWGTRRKWIIFTI